MCIASMPRNVTLKFDKVVGHEANGIEAWIYPGVVIRAVEKSGLELRH